MKLLVLAGEESGVHYAERISAAVRARRPDVEIRGYSDYGFKTADLAVFGIWAVLRRIFFFLVSYLIQSSLLEIQVPVLLVQRSIYVVQVLTPPTFITSLRQLLRIFRRKQGSILLL